jgi:hypothetical protein
MEITGSRKKEKRGKEVRIREKTVKTRLPLSGDFHTAIILT